MKKEINMEDRIIAVSKRNEGVRRINVEDLDDYDVRLWDVIVDKDEEFVDCHWCNETFKSLGDVICPKCGESINK